MGWFTKKNDSDYSITLTLETYKHNVQLDISRYPKLQKQLQLLNLTTEVLAIIKQLQRLTKDLIPEMINQFYAAISLSPDSTSFIEHHKLII